MMKILSKRLGFLIIILFCENSFCVDILQPIEDLFASLPKLHSQIANIDKEEFLEQIKAGDHNEDNNLDVPGLCAKYGYELETHTVTTDDGYILTVYRIPSKSKGEPVLIMPGVLTNADTWFVLGPQKSLPYLLADAKYDVWVASYRGSSEISRGHVSLSADTEPAKYWDFSWDEIGRYDIPALIDKSLEITGKSKLKYVGHSQGTTTVLVTCAVRPEYNDKISIAALLSPVAFMSHIKSPLLRILAPGVPLFKNLLKLIGIHSVDPKSPLVKLVTKVICGETAVATLLCNNIVFLLGGFDYSQLNATNLPNIYSHASLGDSMKQLYHYGQEIVSGKFCAYDYGRIKNIEKYGQSTPPDYPIDKITAPIALFYRPETDYVSAYEDVVKLKSLLPNVADFYEVPHENFCHTDYIWAKDADKLVYDHLLKLFQKY